MLMNCFTQQLFVKPYLYMYIHYTGDQHIGDCECKSSL